MTSTLSVSPKNPSFHWFFRDHCPTQGLAGIMFSYYWLKGRKGGKKEEREGGRNGKGQEQFLGLSLGDWVGDKAINQLRDPWRRGSFRNANNEFDLGQWEIQNWILGVRAKIQIWLLPACHGNLKRRSKKSSQPCQILQRILIGWEFLKGHQIWHLEGWQ